MPSRTRVACPLDERLRAVAERLLGARQCPDTLEDAVMRTLSADERNNRRRLLERALEGLFSEARV
jgi:hypothetical protein